MALTNEEAVKQGDELYERYGKPLEAEHWGEFVAVAPDGRMMVGSEKADVLHNASLEFGERVRVLKVGPQEVYRMRSPVKAKTICKRGCTDSRAAHAFDDVDAFYKRYGKSLEAEHWGKVVAIGTDGRTLLGTDVYDVEGEALDALGDCFILFKVGLMPVERIRL